MDTNPNCVVVLGMRPHGTGAQLENRRRRAVALLRQGKTFRSVASAVASSLSSVVRWYRAFRKNGRKALQPKLIPGRPPRLHKTQIRRLKMILLRGPGAIGYSTELWTLQRIAQLIEKEFGVRYHIGHVWKVMSQELGWSCQKPERRAIQRDEKAIERWKKTTWPAIKKNRTTWGPSGIPRRKRFPAHSQRPQDVGPVG
jgi:transposase